MQDACILFENVQCTVSQIDISCMTELQELFTGGGMLSMLNTHTHIYFYYSIFLKSGKILQACLSYTHTINIY